MDKVFKVAGVIVDSKDQKYFIENPGKDFSPSRNKAIVEQTIQETDKYFQTLANIHNDEMGNRIDILSSYGAYRLGGKGFKEFKAWAGKDLHDKLIGERILERVKIADSVNKLRGNRKHSILI